MLESVFVKSMGTSFAFGAPCIVIFGKNKALADDFFKHQK